jgi:superfamily II DNA or RNA helicase
MNIILREYQQEIIRALRDSIKQGNKRLVMCAPTGAG